MGCLDHIGLGVSDIAKARKFYEAALAPLGITEVAAVSSEETGDKAHVGYGKQKPEFWITSGGPGKIFIHVAFAAENRAEVDAFHKAAMAAGGKDNGAPGLRPHYHPNYYGAFVFDPDGNNIEAVCHKPE